MNKKLAYFGLGIICTILVASLFTFATARWPWEKVEPALSPKTSTSYISANDCSADGVCETQSVKIDDLANGPKSYACIGQDGIISSNSGSCINSEVMGCGGISGEVITKAMELSAQGVRPWLIQFSENEVVFESGYLVIPTNFLEVRTISNSSSSIPQDDLVVFRDLVTGNTYDASITQEGRGTVSIAGNVYALRYFDDRRGNLDSAYVILDYPQSSLDGKINLELCF